MRFWDTSALVPLLVEQAPSPRARELLGQDPEIATWWASPIECWSALARLRRENRLLFSEEGSVQARLSIMRELWTEIFPSDQVRDLAGRLLRTHPLRAADAAQLAAALVWASGRAGAEFVVFDARLGDAAQAEGLVPLA